MQITEKTAIAQAEASQSSLPATKQINVTNLTPKQQRELFCDCISQEGFTGFAKKKSGNQSYYIFTYGK
jgi:hypothetical protein